MYLSSPVLLTLLLLCGLPFASSFSGAFDRSVSKRRIMSTSFSTMPRRSLDTINSRRQAKLAEERRREWIDRSVDYYSKVMREERRRNLGQSKELESPTEKQEYLVLAKKHYFALQKIRDGKPDHAESIYRRIIHEISSDDDRCDHAKLAVTTLLLALHLQRLGDVKATRSAFLSFFRVVVQEKDADEECACSAKVLQAFALFEMKQGNTSKSLDLALKAIQLDNSLSGLLKWKQFRKVMDQRRASYQPGDSYPRPTSA